MANKGLRIVDLSPPQELTNSESNSQIIYEGKTPTKGQTTNDNGKRKVKTREEYIREFTKWKKEKELKRKLEKRNQKPLFKVHHVAHADTSIYNKNAKKGSSTFVPSKTKQKIVEPEAQVIKAPAKIPAVKSKKPEVSKPVSKVSALAPVTGRVTSSQNAAKENKNVNIQSKPNRPTTRSTRTSQKQKICDSVKTSASKKNVNEKKVAGKTSASKKNVNEKKVAGKKKPSNLNLEKVSTSRGISFAPDDFTFSSPSSVSTYEFKPLSPASTANFLYPATTSFISTDPKRCSTPKPHSHEEGPRSKKKRRKTQHDHPVNPKSPGEWVKLLKNSPMVEMNRRTPRTTPLEPLLGLDLDMEFDVDQQTSQPTCETETGTMSLQSTELPNALSATVNVTVPCTPQTDSAPCQQLTSTVTQDDTAKPEDSNVEMSEPTVLNQESSEKHNEVPSKPEEHDVEYFRNLMATETNTFNGYCSKWEDVSKSTPEIDEEVEGQIRTCIGQAQLLIAQHFKQLKGLVDNCEFRTGEKETTLTDLQGFWDMIYYQVEDVHTKLTGLEKLKDNNWVQDKPKVTKNIVKKKPVAKPTVKRPAVASKFAAFRAQMKKKQTAPDILCHEEQAVTFDGGFFKVASPKKTPKFHCEAGSPQRKVSVSPAEKEKVSETTVKEKVTEPKKKPLMEVLSPSVNSLGLTTLRTPSRKSYVPVYPSPLLFDITPQVASKGRPAPHSKRMCTGVETETSLNNEENDVDDFFANDNAVKPIPAVKCVTGTPWSKVSPRRSLRTRRSLFDTSSPSSAKESESDNDFLKYIQPSSTTVSQATNNVNALDDECDAWDPSTAFSASDYVKKDSPAVSRRRSSSLKQLPSTQRRRSTRRSVHFSTSPTTEHTPELENITDVDGAVSEDMLLFTPPGHKSSIQLHDYVSNSMNAGATPACRNPRPSLLYTPPENASPLSRTTTHTEIPTDILVSFTP